MSGGDVIGNRMKENYENRYRFYLTRRTPAIIRIDGKAFHTFTKKFKRPYDDILVETMIKTTKQLCTGIEGCVLGYTQSDEISLLITDFKRFNTNAWFDYNIQKMVSIASSMATLHFNKIFLCKMLDYNGKGLITDKEFDIYNNAYNKGALFDARVFNVPKEEVNNYFVWRQADAIRNSIEMLGRSKYSPSQLNKVTTTQMKNMLEKEHNVSWDKLDPKYKQGTTCYKLDFYVEGIRRTTWDTSSEVVFKGNQDFIDDLLCPLEV